MSAGQAGPAKMAGSTVDADKKEESLPPEVVAMIVGSIFGNRQRPQAPQTFGTAVMVKVIQILLYSSILGGTGAVLYGSWLMILLQKPIPLLIGGWSLFVFGALIFKTFSRK